MSALHVRPLPVARLSPDHRVVDLALAVGLAALALFGTYLASQNQPEARGLDALAVVLLAGGALALVARRRYPVAVLAVATATTLGYELLDYPGGPIWGALIVAFFHAHTTGHRRAGFVAALVGWTNVWWMPPLSGDEPAPAAEAVAFTAWMLVLVAVAEVVRVRRAYVAAERERAEEVEQARRSEERLRIARELHDVLAHNISLINVQASTALHLLDDAPEHARPALAAIKGASGAALSELRAVLDMLRGEDGAARTPVPALAELGDVIAQARAAGLDVELRTEGAARRLPAAVELAAFRICQEAVTNVIRHAGPARATVTLRYSAETLDLAVEDDGRGGGAEPAGGKGLAGMRERVAALGGVLEAGDRPGGGFRVHATLPLEGAA